MLWRWPFSAVDHLLNLLDRRCGKPETFGFHFLEHPVPCPAFVGIAADATAFSHKSGSHAKAIRGKDIRARINKEFGDVELLRADRFNQWCGSDLVTLIEVGVRRSQTLNSVFIAISNCG